MQNIEFECAVEPGRKAQVMPAMRERVNQEFFYFSGSEARDRFRKDPAKYAGELTDPVTQARFEPDADSPKLVFEGRRFYFSADSTRKTFLDSPESYWERPPDAIQFKH
jgi:YHS domain-containing protein